MGRKSLCYVLRGWHVTEIGGKGIHKLCRVEDGIANSGKSYPGHFSCLGD